MVNVPDISKNYRIDVRQVVGEMSEGTTEIRIPLSRESTPANKWVEYREPLMEDEMNVEAYFQKRKQEFEKQEEEAVINENKIRENEENFFKPRLINDDKWKAKFGRQKSETCLQKWCCCCFSSSTESGERKKGLVPRIAEKVQKIFDSLGAKLGFDVPEPEDDPDDDYYNINRVK